MVQPVQRVFLIAHYNLYQTKRHFLAQVAEGFRRCGIEVQLAELRDLMEDEYCQQIRDFKPDMTVTFTVFHQDNQGLFLWDYLKIPHLFILVDPALFSCEPIQSPFSMIACVDSFDIDFLAAQDFRRSFFLPHGVDRDYVTQPLIGKRSTTLFLSAVTMILMGFELSGRASFRLWFVRRSTMLGRGFFRIMKRIWL